MIVVLLIFLVLIPAFTVCTVLRNEKTMPNSSIFTVLEDQRDMYIVYCKTTNVMYSVSKRNGDMTLLMNEDGTPMTYDFKH